MQSRMAVDEASEEVIHETVEYDPNEPTYCFCNRPSFGEMIGKWLSLFIYREI